MRGARKLGWLVLLVVLTAACDTTQPLQLDEQTFALNVRGLGGVVPVYNVYDMFEDSNGDGAADDIDGDGDGDFFLWCKSTTSTANASSVPFGYTIEITILREGTTEREMVTSTAAMTDTSLNITDYDTQVPNIPGVPPTLAPITEGVHTYKFENGRRRSAANITVAAATSNPLSTAVPGTYGIGNGLCSLVFYGPAVIDAPSGNAYPLTFVLRKGDTVTVKAIRATDAFPNGVPIQLPSNVALVATLNSDGRPVNVSGSFATDPGQGPNASFAFTFRSF